MESPGGRFDSFDEFFNQQGDEIDALVVEAEIGTAWTLLHPEYAVVVPKSSRLTIPLGFAVAAGNMISPLSWGAGWLPSSPPGNTGSL